MPTGEAVFQNYAEFSIKSQVDLSAAAAVGATRGDGATWAKTGTGTYTCTIKSGGGMRLVEQLGALAFFSGSAPGLAQFCRVSSITQTADSDNIVITVKTQALQVTAVNTDATLIDRDTNAATTLNVDVTIRTAKMTNPLS